MRSRTCGGVGHAARNGGTYPISAVVEPQTRQYRGIHTMDSRFHSFVSDDTLLSLAAIRSGLGNSDLLCFTAIRTRRSGGFANPFRTMSLASGCYSIPTSSARRG